MRHVKPLPMPVCGVEDRERRVTIRADRLELGSAQRPGDVALAERPAGPRREHEVVGADESRSVPMLDQDPCELRRDRHGPRRSVCLRRSQVPVPVDLVGKLDLSIFGIVDPDIGPFERQQLREPCAVSAATVKGVR